MAENEVRARLEEIARLQKELPTRRATAVAAARADGMTWAEIAAILDMTVHGLIKADKKWQESK